MADERTTPAFLPSALPRDGRPAFSRPPVPAPLPPSPIDPGGGAADSHARPIAMPEVSERPPITPAPATRLSSRPPPLPAFFPPPRESDDQKVLGYEESVDERTPVSVTKPSLPYDVMVPGARLPTAPSVVVVDSLEAFDPLLAPLPPPAVIEPPPGGYRTSFGSDGAPSSGPVSSGRPPTSVAPPMPQIPKPVAAGRPMIQAPGIVSTQAIPLTIPAKKRGRSPLFVAFAAALIGGIIALAIGLSMKPRAKAAAASGPEAPTAAAAPAAIEAPPATAAIAATAASSAPAESGASAVAAAPASTAAPRQSASTSAALATPPAPPRAPRKSDRIED